jgi:hypothetical protein
MMSKRMSDEQCEGIASYVIAVAEESAWFTEDLDRLRELVGELRRARLAETTDGATFEAEEARHGR